MSQEGGSEGLDGLLMGNVSEDAKENDEQIAARIAAAQARMAKIRKQEKKAQKFDTVLAKMIPDLGKEALEFVIFCIDHEVPSLTILAGLSLHHPKAEKVCHEAFVQYIEEKADFSLVKFQSPEVEEKISLWWTFLVGADMSSDTVKLKDSFSREGFPQGFLRYMASFLKSYLKTHHEAPYDESALVQMIRLYSEKLFEVEMHLKLS